MKRSTRKSAEARAVSASELGRLLRRHRNTIAEWIGDGCPVLARGRREEGAEHRLDPAAVVEWLLQRERDRERERWQPKLEVLEAALAGGSAEEDGERVSEAEAKRRRAVARARLEELELDRKSGELAPTRLMVRAVVGLLVRVRDRILSTPQRSARELAIADEPSETHTILDTELRSALEELADPETVADTIRRAALEEDAA